jgi:hypothetical protein
MRKIKLRGHHIGYIAEVLDEVGYSGTDSDIVLERSKELEKVKSYGAGVYNFVKSVVKDLREKRDLDIEITDTLDSICHKCLAEDNTSLEDAPIMCIDPDGEERHTIPYCINEGSHYSSKELVTILVLFKAFHGVASPNRLRALQDKPIPIEKSYNINRDLDSMLKNMQSYAA